MGSPTTPENVCKTCGQSIDAQFGAAGTRDIEVIASDLYVNTCCFVRDEIRFVNQGRLIFRRQGTDGKEGDYCREYHVICRKLVVVGGSKPGSINPCGPDDPGQIYEANNVITWFDRLKKPPTGSDASATQANDGTNFDRDTWSSAAPNDNGRTGGQGDPGAEGGRGDPGLSAPRCTIVALEIDIGATDHLTIDMSGQVGSKGGRGQDGGDGGSGEGGRDGVSDTSWPGEGCDRQPGDGGDGGTGGAGGKGGDGRGGGDASDITALSTLANVTTTGFVGGNFTFLTNGGQGGEGGLGGFGGKGGLGGKPGTKTSECSAALNGGTGLDGNPVGIGPGSTSNQGSLGSQGNAATSHFKKLGPGGCLAQLPLPITVTSVVPQLLCRPNGAGASLEVAVNGTNLDSVTAITTSLAGVVLTKKITSIDTRLDLDVALASNSAVGLGPLVLARDFGASFTQPNAIDVRQFAVSSVAPNTGARGTTVAVTISGQCFDTTSVLNQVTLSGIGINALNLVVVNSTTLTCNLEIAAAAQVGARNLTVQTGAMSHTLLNGFTVT